LDTLTHNLTQDKVVCKSREEVQLQLGIVLGFRFLDFLLGALSLRERCTLSWLSVGSGTTYGIILFVKGDDAWGWLRAYGWVKILQYCLW
jgi:hypothetical protein